MTREEIISLLTKMIEDESYQAYDDIRDSDYSCVADWHLREVEPLRQALEKLLSRRDAPDFIEGKDAYMQVDVNDMNNALNLLKLAREVA